MNNPKFRVAIKSPHWDNYPADTWVVSTNSFTIGEFWDHVVELEFKNGESLPFGDIDWADDTVEYLQYVGVDDIYNGDILGFESSGDHQEWQSYSGGIPRIEWRDKYGAFRICNGVENDNGVAMYEFSSKYVIGNVLENKEMLNG